jgi:hypothetical protein
VWQNSTCCCCTFFIFCSPSLTIGESFPIFHLPFSVMVMNIPLPWSLLSLIILINPLFSLFALEHGNIGFQVSSGVRDSLMVAELFLRFKASIPGGFFRLV